MVTQNDWQHWNNAIDFWTEKVEAYTSMSLPEDAVRCRAMVFRASLLRDEAEGKIFVITGRAKPAWARPGARMAQHIDSQMSRSEA